MLAIVRGGGSKLDLAVFDTEVVARAIAAAPVPVLTGIGHEMDRTIADEAAAVAEKTPSAAGEWLVSRVAEFAGRLDRARAHIGREGREALRRHRHQLRVAMADVSGAALTLRRQEDHLHRLGADLARGSRRVVERHQVGLETLRQWFSAIDLEPTLRRGFAIVTAVDRGTVIKTVGQVSPGDLLSIRFADGTVLVEVSDE
jgi:exodeoxyribonuclease VII large subunit